MEIRLNEIRDVRTGILNFSKTKSRIVFEAKKDKTLHVPAEKNRTETQKPDQNLKARAFRKARKMPAPITLERNTSFF